MIAMNRNRLSLEDILAVLARTPASLTALLGGLPNTWINATEGDTTWSPYDVIGHLINGERTNWIPRARHILSGDPRPFDPFDRTPAQGQEIPLSQLLSTFDALRRDNVTLLVGMNLTTSDLSRTGLHPELGEVSLGQLLATWAVHDLDHMGQIVRTMSKVYVDEVGPWGQYLSILKDRQRKLA